MTLTFLTLNNFCYYASSLANAHYTTVYGFNHKFCLDFTIGKCFKAIFHHEGLKIPKSHPHKNCRQLISASYSEIRFSISLMAWELQASKKWLKRHLVEILSRFKHKYLRFYVRWKKSDHWIWSSIWLSSIFVCMTFWNFQSFMAKNGSKIFPILKSRQN